jgi:hypothetical protein
MQPEWYITVTCALMFRTKSQTIRLSLTSFFFFFFFFFFPFSYTQYISATQTLKLQEDKGKAIPAADRGEP